MSLYIRLIRYVFEKFHVIAAISSSHCSGRWILRFRLTLQRCCNVEEVLYVVDIDGKRTADLLNFPGVITSNHHHKKFTLTQQWCKKSSGTIRTPLLWEARWVPEPSSVNLWIIHHLCLSSGSFPFVSCVLGPPVIGHSLLIQVQLGPHRCARIDLIHRPRLREQT